MSKSRKKVVLFGTRHYTVSTVPADVANALERTMDKLKPNIILEEWSKSQIKESAASVIGKNRNLRWYDIGTPNDGEFATYTVCDALDFPSGATLYRYGPISSQSKREERMCVNIATHMSSFDVSLVVIGIGHMHSMFERLAQDFDVDGYSFANEFF